MLLRGYPVPSNAQGTTWYQTLNYGLLHARQDLAHHTHSAFPGPLLTGLTWSGITSYSSWSGKRGGGAALSRLSVQCPFTGIVRKNEQGSSPVSLVAYLLPATELLILAHHCFSLTCHMEGIIRVLQAARLLTDNHLAPNEEYGLVVSFPPFFLGTGF